MPDLSGESSMNIRNFPTKLLARLRAAAAMRGETLREHVIRIAEKSVRDERAAKRTLGHRSLDEQPDSPQNYFKNEV